MSRKLKEILKKNAEFEKQAPYNFCDRWCQRCNSETQHRCTLYLEDFDRRITNIANGRDTEDLEILEEDLGKRLEAIESSSEQWIDDDFDYTDIDEDAYDELRRKEEQLNDHTLMRVTKQYTSKAYDFLKEVFYEKVNIQSDLQYDYETVSWYHTLLSAKMYRALCGLYADEHDEYDFGLCDAVAQLAVCKKAIGRSDKALQNISKKNAHLRDKINELLALLHNIYSQIKIIEDEI